MDKEYKHGGNNGFSNGILLGALLGAGAVFLFGTDKGRKLLKRFSQEGVESLSAMGDSWLEKYLDEEDQEIGDIPADEFDSENEEGSSKKISSNIKKRLFQGVKKSSK